jgi:uncharacterized damage-inducible protein DinB
MAKGSILEQLEFRFAVQRPSQYLRGTGKMSGRRPPQAGALRLSCSTGEQTMTIAEILLQDYDTEVKSTRTTLERVPVNLADFKPHEKSMPMGRLAMHVATLPRFASAILSVKRMDLATEKFPPNTFESTEATVRTFEQASSELRDTLARQSDADLEYKWTMVFGDKPIANAPRSLLFRTMYLNHQIHHRAQLGVYLRLNNLPVPALYGPSADDRMGF